MSASLTLGMASILKADLGRADLGRAGLACVIYRAYRVTVNDKRCMFEQFLNFIGIYRSGVVES